jgi:hypothetical protein
MCAGNPPPHALLRVLEDDLRNPKEIIAPELTNDFAMALARGLALFPKNRPQSIAEFRKLLVLTDSPAVASPVFGESSISFFLEDFFSPEATVDTDSDTTIPPAIVNKPNRQVDIDAGANKATSSSLSLRERAGVRGLHVALSPQASIYRQKSCCMDKSRMRER